MITILIICSLKCTGGFFKAHAAFGLGSGVVCVGWRGGGGGGGVRGGEGV